MMAFLDNADQHQQPDHGNEAQVHAEQSQRQERPYDGGGQAGQDCEGVNIAFVQDAQHDIDRHHSRDQQNALISKRVLIRLGTA